MNQTKNIIRIICALALSLTALIAALGQQPRVIGRTYKESKPAWEPSPQAPRGAPNVIYLVLDDVGYAQLGCYGSEIQTPNLGAVIEIAEVGGLHHRYKRRAA